jgi:hypothetical protein
MTGVFAELEALAEPDAPTAGTTDEQSRWMLPQLASTVLEMASSLKPPRTDVFPGSVFQSAAPAVI